MADAPALVRVERVVRSRSAVERRVGCSSEAFDSCESFAPPVEPEPAEGEALG